MKYRLLLVVALVVSGLACFTFLAGAQTQQPEMSVTPSFNGYFKYGEWLPLQIELMNSGDDIEAEVQVRVPRNSGGMTFKAPVSLPSGAHKVLTLYILPNNYSHSVEVNLIQNDEVLTSQKAELHPIMNINVLVGLLASNRQALSLIQGVDYPNNMRPVEVIDLNVEQLPEKIEGLRSFDVLVINDMDTSDLSPEQVEAIRGWVHGGGRLVIGGGAGAARSLSGLPEDLLPVRFKGDIQVEAEDLSGLADFSGSEGLDDEGVYLLSEVEVTGSSLLATDQSTLASEVQHGAGFVDFVALDLSDAPFDGWSGTVEFWETLLRSKEDYYDLPSDMSQRSLFSSSMSYPLTNIPTMELPSIKWLAIILGFYILVIGPLNYFMLKRKNRLHLAWVSIPGITLIFSAAAFGSGYMMRGNDILVHKIGVVQIQTDQVAQLTTFMGLFSPSQTSYQIEVSGDSLLSPMIDEYMSYSPGTTPGETIMVQGDPVILQGLSVNQWSMQSFMTEQSWQNLGTISGDLMIRDGKLAGTVKNETTLLLHDVAVIVKNGYQKIGDLAPGEETDVELELVQESDDRYWSVFYRMYGDLDQELDKTERAQNELKRSIIEPLFENSMNAKVLSSSWMVGATDLTNSSSQVLVLGWIEEVPPDITISSVAPDIQSTGLVYTYLDYEIPRTGKVNIPPGILEARMLDTNAGVCGGYNSISFYMDRQTKAQVEYQLPSRNNLDYLELDVQLELDMPTDVQSLELSLYDWQSQQWILFKDVVEGLNMVEKPDRFINEGGEVQLQLYRNNENPSGGCVYLDMGFKAEGKGDK